MRSPRPRRTSSSCPQAEVKVPGSIVYAKAGNIWIQTGKQANQLTDGGHDSMPSWSPDGKDIYFVRTTRRDRRSGPSQGVDRRLPDDGPGRHARQGRRQRGPRRRPRRAHHQSGGRDWFSWIRQPVVSPDGQTLAMVSDGPEPVQERRRAPVLRPDERRSGRSRPSSEIPPLGHQDPAWRPDGKVLLYVRNGRDGTRGAPVIYRWDVAKKTLAPLTGPGYLEPSYSPDGRYIAATKTSSFGNDVVILDAANGRELLRVTDRRRVVGARSGRRPAMRSRTSTSTGQIVDLEHGPARRARRPTGRSRTTIALTEVSGLDGASRPGWFVPPDQLPAPTPAPSASVGRARSERAGRVVRTRASTAP